MFAGISQARAPNLTEQSMNPIAAFDMAEVIYANVAHEALQNEVITSKVETRGCMTQYALWTSSDDHDFKDRNTPTATDQLRDRFGTLKEGPGFVPSTLSTELTLSMNPKQNFGYDSVNKTSKTKAARREAASRTFSIG